jgi:tetratricopeptide (TPR) repeat protein
MRRNRLIIGIAIIAALAGAAATYWILQSGDVNDLALATEALDRRDFSAAAKYLDLHLKDNPTDVNAALLAAQTARRSNHFAAVKQYAEQYRQLGGSERIYILERQLTQIQFGDLALGGDLVATYQDRPSAESYLVMEAYIEGHLKIFDIAPESPEYFERIRSPRSAAIDERAAQAIDWWLKNRTKSQDQSAGYFWRARIHLVQSDRPGAVADFRKALELNPMNLDCRLRYAKEIIQVDPREAVAQFRVANQQKPNDRLIQYVLAESLRNVGALEEAAQVLDHLLDSDPSDLTVLLGRANVAMEANQAAEAETYLRRAEQIDRNNLVLLNAMSRCLVLAGKPEEAQRYREPYQKLLAERVQAKKAKSKE